MRRLIRFTGAVVALMAFSLGCPQTPGANGSGSDAGTPWIEVGTGARSFQVIPDVTRDGGLENLSVVTALYGGFHIWAAVRAHNMNPGDLQVVVTTSLVSPRQQLYQTSSVVTLVPDDVGESWAGIPGYVDPFVVRNQIMELRIDARDADGKTASATKQFWARYDTP